MKIRVGQGYDVHQLVAGRPLILGGVTIGHDKGLLGHSDADVLIHVQSIGTGQALQTRSPPAGASSPPGRP